MRKKILGLTAVLLAGATLTACGASKAVPPVQTPAPGAANGTAQATTTVPAPVTDPIVIRTVNDDKLGTIVQDGNGNTLYAFTNDSDGKSVCNDACATTWPPSKVVDKGMTTQGIEQALVTTITRADGSTQLALNKWPLYRFAADGDGTGTTKGQGNKGVWFVLNAEGKLNKTAVAGAPVAPAPTAAPAAPVVPSAGTLDGASLVSSATGDAASGNALIGVGGASGSANGAVELGGRIDDSSSRDGRGGRLLFGSNR